MILDKIKAIREDVACICEKAGRNPAEIILVGVTKFASAEQIQEAISVGLKDVGENKVQQAKEKFPVLGPAAENVTKHMIGHLQTNKVKDALNLFDMIQSVDSFHLAEEIEKQAAKQDMCVDILIQVNCAGEEQKFGVAPQDAIELVEQVSRLRHVRILGLMTIAPFVEDEEVIRQSFAQLRKLFDEVGVKFEGQQRVEMKWLSMGMTHDYKIAIEQGANMIRVGRAIFA